MVEPVTVLGVSLPSFTLSFVPRLGPCRDDRRRVITGGVLGVPLPSRGTDCVVRSPRVTDGTSTGRESTVLNRVGSLRAARPGLHRDFHPDLDCLSTL